MDEVFLAYLEPADGCGHPIMSMHRTEAGAERALKALIMDIYDFEDGDEMTVEQLAARLDEEGRLALVDAYAVGE